MKLLTLRTLGEMDKDRVGRVLQKHLQTVQADCMNRPCNADGKTLPRKVLVEITFTPEIETDEFGVPHLSGIESEVIVTSKLPKDRSNPVRLAVGNDGMFFSPIDNQNPKARDLFAGSETEENADELDR